jgi:predicted DNA binding CopG/RHH family protein
MNKKDFGLDLTQLEAVDNLDDEELDLYIEMKAGNYVLHTDNPTKEKYSNIFKEATRRSKAISLRLQENDYIGIKAKAIELGMPYQSLNNSIIHRFLAGDFNQTGKNAI